MNIYARSTLIILHKRTRKMSEVEKNEGRENGWRPVLPYPEALDLPDNQIIYLR